MRRTLLLLASLIFVALGSIAAAQIPNVPDTSRYVAYNVTSSTTNFDVPFAIYGDCTDLTVKVAGVVQTGGFTCISKSLTPFANVAQPVTDAQVQFTTGVANALVEIIGARHPRFSMGTAPGITRTEFNRDIGTIVSTQREIYDKVVPLGASTMAGFGIPAVTLGTSGSYYFDLATGNVYGPKTNAWPVNPAFSPSVFTPLNPNIAFVTGAAGVVCNGVTDANAGGALQAVISNAATAKRRLFWPSGADCHIKTAFIFPSNADWEGFGTTISFDATVNTAGSLNVAMSLDNAANWRISGITFNGPGSASINQNARVAGVSPSNGLIINSTFQNFGTQTAFTGTLTSGSPTVTSVSSVAGLKVGMSVSLNNATVGTITAVGTSTITISPAATTNGVSSLIANFYAQGLLAFGPTNITVRDSTIQNNSGDGIAFSNNARGSRILYSKFSNNQDSQVVPCTIGGSDNQVIGNTVTAPSGITNPAIVLDRCQSSVVAFNTVSSGAGSAAIRIARYADSTDINQDNKIVGNTVSGGGNISVESSGTVQGSQTVTKGGMAKVIGNTVISPSGSGIAFTDSSNSEAIGNAVTGAGGEGVMELASTSGVNTGNNIISGNTIDGATYCLRQIAVGGTIIKSQYTGNDPRNCSVTPTQFVNADFYDRGSVSGNAATATTASAMAATGLTGTIPAARMPALTGTCTTTVGTVATTCTGDGSWNTYSPTLSWSTAAPTITSTNIAWKQTGTKTYSLRFNIVLSATGACTGFSCGFVFFTFPNSAVPKINQLCIFGTAVGDITGYWAMAAASGIIQFQPASGTWAAKEFIGECSNIEVN